MVDKRPRRGQEKAISMACRVAKARSTDTRKSVNEYKRPKIEYLRLQNRADVIQEDCGRNVRTGRRSVRYFLYLPIDERSKALIKAFEMVDQYVRSRRSLAA